MCASRSQKKMYSSNGRGNISLPACNHETMANLLQLDESSSDSDWVIYVKKDHKSSLVTGGIIMHRRVMECVQTACVISVVIVTAATLFSICRCRISTSLDNGDTSWWKMNRYVNEKRLKSINPTVGSLWLMWIQNLEPDGSTGRFPCKQAWRTKQTVFFCPFKSFTTFICQWDLLTKFPVHGLSQARGKKKEVYVTHGLVQKPPPVTKKCVSSRC